MQLHELQRSTKNKSSKRIGRGGSRGKTSGRGHKGQKQHGGHGIRPELRDTIKKLPKMRGHGRNRARTITATQMIKPIILSLTALETTFDSGDTVSPQTLLQKNIIGKKSKRHRGIKILANGTLSKKLVIENCAVSAKAKEAIEKTGGSVSLKS